MPTLSGMGDGVTGPSGSSFQMATRLPQMVGGTGRAMAVIRWTMTKERAGRPSETILEWSKKQLSYAV